MNKDEVMECWISPFYLLRLVPPPLAAPTRMGPQRGERNRAVVLIGTAVN